MKALIYSPGQSPSPITDPVEIEQGLKSNPPLIWLDFDQALTASDIKRLESWFGFHELALEDASKADGQRPKVEEYDDHFFLVMHALSAHKEARFLRLERHEIDLFVGRNYVVSVHRRPLPEVDRVWRDALKRTAILSNGSDRLTYFLLDAVVDSYIEIVDQVEDVLDELEDAVVDPGAGQEAVQDIFTFKRHLIHFRKTAGPLREVINEMTSREFPFVQQQTLFYLRDVYDHLMRLSDMVDSYRDILTGALDVHLSAVSNRLNEVMKRLTIVATIFMPITFLSGFWGMNFVGLPFDSGVWMWGNVVLMLVVILAMAAYFRRRDWL